MAQQTTNALVTLETFNISQLDLENQVQRPREGGGNNEEDEILNIGEFVFDHITRETDGSIIQRLRRRVAIHSKLVIKSCTFIDMITYILFLLISLFLLVQNGSIIAIQMTWMTYLTLILTFIEGIILVWVLKVLIETGYQHKAYIAYILYRLISITILMSTIIGISSAQLIEFSNASDSRTKTAKNYFVTTICIIVAYLTYLILSSILYGFHMSVVKEFYTIVRIILEAHTTMERIKSYVSIGSPVPHFSIGVPIFKNDSPNCKDKNDDNYNLSLRDAKFEVEIQLQNDNLKDAKPCDKIKLFQCDSESSDSESNRIKIESCQNDKKKSQKILRGRRLTMQEDEYFEGSRNRQDENISSNFLSSKCVGLAQNTILEEEDDRYGLDFLEEYQKQHKTNGEGITAFTSEGEMVFSPVSRHTLRRKYSVKKVVRKQSFSSHIALQKRRFTINDDTPADII